MKNYCISKRSIFLTCVLYFAKRVKLLRLAGSGFKVQGSRFRVQGSGLAPVFPLNDFSPHAIMSTSSIYISIDIVIYKEDPYDH